MAFTSALTQETAMPINLCDTENKVELVLVRKVIVSCSRSRLVSSAEYFRALLDGQFAEAGQDVVELHGDNVEAILELPQHIHHNPNSSPYRQYTVEDLTRMAIICDKYRTAKQMAPLVKRHLNALGLFNLDILLPIDSFLAPGSVPTEPLRASEVVGNHLNELMAICHTFKLAHHFQILLKYTVFHMCMVDKNWMVLSKSLDHPLELQRR